MPDSMKLLIAVLPEILVFSLLGIFVKTSKKIDFLTIPGLDVNNISDENKNIYCTKFFKATMIACGILIVFLAIFELLLQNGVLTFETCVKWLLPITILDIISLVIWLSHISYKYSR